MDTKKINIVKDRETFGYADFKAESNKDNHEVVFRCVGFNSFFLSVFDMSNAEGLSASAICIMSEKTSEAFDWQECFLETLREEQARRFEIYISEKKLSYQVDLIAKGNDILSMTLWQKDERKQNDRFSNFDFPHVFDQLTSGYTIYSVKRKGTRATDYIFREVNQKSTETKKEQKDAIIGKSIADLGPSIKHFGIIPSLKKAWETGEAQYLPPQHYEDENFDGWYDNVIFKMPNEEVVSLYRDVTSWLKVQQALEESRAELNLYFQKAPIGIVIFDDKGNYIDVNEAICAFTGKKREEMVKCTIDESFIPYERDEIVALLNRLKKEGSIEADISSTRSNGTVEYFRLRGEKISATRFMCFIMDITQEKQLGEEVRRRGALLEHYFEHAPVCIFALNQAGEIVDCNKMATQQLGYSKAQLMNQKLYQYVDESTVGSAHQCLNVIEKMGRIVCEQLFVTSENKRIIISINGAKLREDRYILFGNDITAEKELQQRLKDSESEYRALFDYAGVGIIYLSPEGRIVWFNKLAAKSFYGNPEKMVNGKLEDVFSKVAAEYFFKRMKETQAANHPMEYEDHFSTPSGDRWQKTVYNCIYDANHSLLGVEIIYQDITDIRLSEHRIKESERKYRSLFENAPTGNHAMDNNGYILDVNKRWLEMTGYSLDEVIGKKFSDFLTPDYRDAYESQYEAFLKSGHINERLGIRKKDGSIGVFRKTGTIDYDDQGLAIQAHCSLEDVSQKERAQKKLYESEKRYRSLFDQATVGIISLRPDGRFMAANQKFCDMVGFTNEELQNRTYLDITHPDDRALSKALFQRDLIEHGRSKETPKRYIKKDGNVLFVSLTTSLITDDDDKPTHLIASIRDLTEQKRIEREKERFEAQIRETQRLESVGILAGGVAHEINNPINGIMNYSQLILDTEKNNEDVIEFANEIIRESHRVSTIVRNLLRFSRQEKEPYVDTNVYDVVDQTLSLIRTLFRHDNIVLEIDVPRDLPRISCRSQQIQQVLMNLMTNARDSLNIKYPVQDHNKRLMISAKLINNKAFNGVRIIVEDHGTGIPDEVKTKMFDPFFTTKGRDKGTGLGLSISHRIIVEHSGRLEVESVKGEYTKIFVDLPVAHKTSGDKV